MKDFGAKFRLIFIPFLYISLTSLALYTFLNWLCCIQTDWYAADEGMVDIFILIVGLWIPLLIWLRPRLKLLDVKSVGRKDPLMVYLIVAWVTIGAPLVLAQKYMVKASGKLTLLDSISNIEKHPSTKYYKVTHYFVDTYLAQMKTFTGVSNKGHSYNMSVCAPSPIYDKDHTLDIGSSIFGNSKNKLLLCINGTYYPPKNFTRLNFQNVQRIDTLRDFFVKSKDGDSIRNDIISVQMKVGADSTLFTGRPSGNVMYIPSAWVTMNYHETISNSSSQFEKDEALNSLLKNARADLDRKRGMRFVYLDKIGRSGNRSDNEDAIRSKGSVKGPYIIFDAVNEPYETRADSLFIGLIMSFAGGPLLFLITLLFKPLSKRKYDIGALERQRKNWSLAMTVCRNVFVLTKDNLATQVLIVMNVLVFIVTFFYSSGSTWFTEWELLHWGANYRLNFEAGQYWRLLTSMFLHTGLIHLLFNLYGLIVAGAFAEPLIGKINFIAIYLLCGIIAGLTSIGWNPEVVRVGSSGAIFGIYGAFLTLLVLSYTPKNWGRAFFVASFFYILLNLLFTITGVVDMVANLVSLLIGLICGVVLSAFIKKPEDHLTSAKKKRSNTNISSL